MLYPFCQYGDFPRPYECVGLIERWKDSKRPIRLIITGTNVNMASCIKGFSYGQKDGSGDVYFTLSLKEYIFISVSTEVAATTQQSNTSTQRPGLDKVQPSSYVIKEGDCLWSIAKNLFSIFQKSYSFCIL